MRHREAELTPSMRSDYTQRFTTLSIMQSHTACPHVKHEVSALQKRNNALVATRLENSLRGFRSQQDEALQLSVSQVDHNLHKRENH